MDIIRQTAEALQYAHERGVIHRDVKPANVMVDGRGWVTVTDFGIAKAVDASSLTGSGAMIGTPYYMSPEQASCTKVTGAADQYSLAVMAYHMLGGHLPFTGESVIEIVRKHCMEPPPPLTVLRPNLPWALVAVAGGITFASLTAGRGHTCGLTSGWAAYCWGWNFFGQLGDSSTTNRTTPVAVVNP